MNYKLTDVNSKVNFLLKTGKDLVKNQMPVAGAKGIISKATNLKKSEIEGYPINVDDKWFFEGEIISEQNPEEETADRAEGE